MDILYFLLTAVQDFIFCSINKFLFCVLQNYQGVQQKTKLISKRRAQIPGECQGAFLQLLPINTHLYPNLHCFSNYSICIGQFYQYAVVLLKDRVWVTVLFPR